MILTDGRWVVSDESVEELYRFARGIGLREAQFMTVPFPHYELLTRVQQVEALMADADCVSAFTAVERAVRQEA